MDIEFSPNWLEYDEYADSEFLLFFQMLMTMNTGNIDYSWRLNANN